MDGSSEETPPAESNCVHCDRLDNADNLVQCDQCDSWWHMSCAGVSQSVESRQWICQTCLQEFASIRSVSRSVASRSSRLDLQLRKLEERYALERKFIEEKYKLLELEMDDSRDDTGAGVSGRGEREDVDKVRLWISTCADYQAGGAVGRTNPPLMTPHISRNLDRAIADGPSGYGSQRPNEEGTVNVADTSSHRRCIEEARTDVLNLRKPDVPSEDYPSTRQGHKPIPKPRRLVFGGHESEIPNVGSLLSIPP